LADGSATRMLAARRAAERMMMDDVGMGRLGIPIEGEGDVAV
jgi:hypothetical protein